MNLTELHFKIIFVALISFRIYVRFRKVFPIERGPQHDTVLSIASEVSRSLVICCQLFKILLKIIKKKLVIFLDCLRKVRNHPNIKNLDYFLIPKVQIIFRLIRHFLWWFKQKSSDLYFIKRLIKPLNFSVTYRTFMGRAD